MSFGEQQSKIIDILEADKRRKSDAMQSMELRKIEEAKRIGAELRHEEMKNEHRQMEEIKRQHAEKMQLENKKREEDAMRRESQMNEAARQMIENENKKIEDKQRQQDILDKNRKIDR